MALSVPTHLAYATDQSGAGVTSKAFASVSPASDCLLIVVGTADSASNSADALSSITTTLSNVGSWTIIEKYTANIGGQQNNFVAYAKVTGAPGSGTVTVNWSGLPQDAISMELLYVTGHDTTTPVPHHYETNGSGSSASGTLSSTPTSTSLVLVLYTVANPTNAGESNVLPGSGFTELGQQYIGNTTYNFGLEIETQYRLTGTGTAIAATGPNDGWALMAIEIAQASASTVTGTVAQTLASFTPTASGSSVTGTSARTLASFTSTASGSSVTGTSAQTLGSFTSSASGTFTPATVSGTVAVTLASFTPAAAGSSTTGTSTQTLASFTPTASGSTVTGTSAQTLGSFTSTAAGAYGTDYVYDDFPGSVIDPTKWVVYNRLGDQVNNEENAVIPANVRVSSGDLLIDSKFEDVVAGDTTTGAPNPRTVHYTSGQVSQIAGSFLYGSVRVRAKLPGGVGLWPCIWMLGYEWQPSQPFTANVAGHNWPNGGWWEIDIAEFIYDHRTQVNCALHFITASRTGSGEKSLPFDATSRYMVYRLDWAPTSLTWYVDAEDGNGFVQLLQMTGTAGTDIPNTPGYLVMHTAVGGNVTNSPDSSTFPQTFHIDYAQVSRTADSVDRPMGYVYDSLGSFTSTASGSSVTGSSTQTLGAFTSTASGTASAATITGTVASTLDAFTSSGAGSTVTGTSARTLASFTPTASGGHGVSGTSAQTLAAFTSSAVGAFGSDPVGTVAVTLASFTSTASGTATPPTITGTVAQTLAAFTAAAGGSSTAGTVAQTLAVFLCAASGQYGTDIVDPFPLALSIRDRGHTVTVRDRGHTTTKKERR